MHAPLQRLPSRTALWMGAGLLLLASAGTAGAARIGDLDGAVRWQDQAVRFLSLRDPAVRYALAGSAILGVTCGLLGSFLVVRRMALVGDALSHAVLPGVALGFLWNQTKDPVAIFVGATAAGLLGTVTVTALTRTTRLKEDAALGMVLAGFFSVGIVLVTLFQKLPSGNKSGIDKFLFGQAAALGPEDVRLMAAVATVVVLVIGIGFKELLLVSFDPAFARVCALPTAWIQRILHLLLAFAVVVALQAVGVVLVSAMLITPAATAYLLTDRFHRMILLGAALGMAAGVAGAFASFLGHNLPTGPFMVLAASAVFGAAFLFAPGRGWLTVLWTRRDRRHRTARENTLKAVYQILEEDGFRGAAVSLRELAERRRATLDVAGAEARALARHGLATLRNDAVALTPAGWQLAATVVRNHRLWELYLTNAADIAPDHVHEDAERIEHLLGEDTVRQLERRLDYATRDPHGKPIPSVADVQSHVGAPRRDETPGYGRRG